MKKYVTLGEVCTKGSSNIAQKDIEQNNGSYGIYGASGYIKDVDFYHQDKPYIAVVKDGAGIGRTMLLPEKTSVIGTMQYLIPKDNVCVEYLYYAVTYMNLAKYFSGATIPHIYFKDYQKEKLPLLTIEEQRKIADNLRKIDRLIELCSGILQKLDVLVKSRFVEMFGDFENLINKWHLYRFSDVTINLDNTRKPIKDADRQKIQGIYPYYGATGIVDYLNDYRIEGEYLLISEDGKALEFRNKDIAFIAKGKIWVNNHAHVLQCKENMNMVFLMFYMNNRDISSWVTGIDQKKLNRDNLDKMPVGVPPLALQERFAAFVEQTDKSKFIAKKIAESVRSVKIL